MEGFSPTRSLTQEKAILVARQGDPKSPAPGTLLARQKILHVELEAAHARSLVGGGAIGGGRTGAALGTSQLSSMRTGTAQTNRQPEQIRRDIRRIEKELIRVQSRLREIDQQITATAEKRNGTA